MFSGESPTFGIKLGSGSRPSSGMNHPGRPEKPLDASGSQGFVWQKLSENWVNTYSL